MSTPKRLRFAIYARYSSDMQNEISLEDQEAICREAIGARNGVVVGVFKDGAEHGWSLDRDGFKKMQAAEKGKFDALMVWKFDRLARDFEQSVIVKAFLRHEYKLKLYCCHWQSTVYRKMQADLWYEEAGFGENTPVEALDVDSAPMRRNGNQALQKESADE